MKQILPFVLLLSCSTQESIEEVTNLDEVDSEIIWTEEDEKRANIERFNYIYSLDTTVWEKPNIKHKNY